MIDLIYIQRFVLVYILNQNMIWFILINIIYICIY